MQNNKVQLQFVGDVLTLTFANEAEFFETLGILCHSSREAKIKGKSAKGHFTFDKHGKLVTNQPDNILSEEDLFGNGRINVGAIGTLYIECKPGIFYTNAFFETTDNLDKSWTIQCPVYAKYLMQEFGFEYGLNDKNDKAVIKAPCTEKVKALMDEKGLNEFVYFFDKGLAAPMREV